eukprot:TRINITY_DN687_c0_g1_i1.p1 TRINITY_DN687_c0_g1~~TRINITY_DN687_c0_g1_i1.p1  ORF type:complete len:566 (+),score=141.43 TRINITY_DN687_c0_g1_i1:90-1787(+)
MSAQSGKRKADTAFVSQGVGRPPASTNLSKIATICTRNALNAELQAYTSDFRGDAAQAQPSYIATPLAQYPIIQLSPDAFAWQSVADLAQMIRDSSVRAIAGLSAADASALANRATLLNEKVQNIIAPILGRPVPQIADSERKKRKSETGSKDVYCDVLKSRCEPDWSTSRPIVVQPSALPVDQELYYVYKGPHTKVYNLARDDGLSWKARFKLAGKGLIGISYDCRSVQLKHLKKHVWIYVDPAQQTGSKPLPTAATSTSSAVPSAADMPLSSGSLPQQEDDDEDAPAIEIADDYVGVPNDPVPSTAANAYQSMSAAAFASASAASHKRERNYGELEQISVGLAVVAYITGTVRGLPMLIPASDAYSVSKNACACNCGQCVHALTKQVAVSQPAPTAATVPAAVPMQQQQQQQPLVAAPHPLPSSQTMAPPSPPQVLAAPVPLPSAASTAALHQTQAQVVQAFMQNVLQLQQQQHAAQQQQQHPDSFMRFAQNVPQSLPQQQPMMHDPQALFGMMPFAQQQPFSMMQMPLPLIQRLPSMTVQQQQQQQQMAQQQQPQQQQPRFL